MATICDVCQKQGAARAHLSRSGKNLAALDICDACVEKFAATTRRSAAKSAAAKRRLRPFVPRELTDSEQPNEEPVAAQEKGETGS